MTQSLDNDTIPITKLITTPTTTTSRCFFLLFGCFVLSVYINRYVAGSSADAVTRNMSSAVEQGLKAAAKADKKKAEEHAENAKGLLRMDLQGGEVRYAPC